MYAKPYSIYLRGTIIAVTRGGAGFLASTAAAKCFQYVSDGDPPDMPQSLKVLTRALEVSDAFWM